MTKYYLISFLLSTLNFVGLNGQDCLDLTIADWTFGPTEMGRGRLLLTVENINADTVFFEEKSIHVNIFKASEPFDTSRRQARILIEARRNAPQYLAPGASFILPTLSVEIYDCGFQYTYITFSSEGFVEGDCQPGGNKFNLFTGNAICQDSFTAFYFDTLAIEALGTEPETYRIPLRISDFENIGAFQVGLLLDGLPSARILEFIHVQRPPSPSGGVNILADGRELRILDYSNSFPSFSLVDSIPLGYLILEADFAAGTPLSILFNESFTEVSDGEMSRRTVRVFSLNGLSNDSGHIAGQLLSSTGTPVSGHLVTLTDGTTTLLDTTDHFGTYSFAISPIVNDFWSVSFAPLADITASRNALSTLDRLILQRHLLGISIISNPLQQFAADFDGNGEIDMLDVLRMQRVILGLESYPLGASSFQYSIDGEELGATFSTSNGENNQVQTIRLGDLNSSGL